MDVRQLRYFHCVARHGNVSRAAAELNVAQPAISRHLKQLEDELGVLLIVRHARGVSLTEAGEGLLAHANFILRQIEQAKLEAIASARDPVGQVSLAVLPTLAEILGAPLAERLYGAFPNVSLVLREGFSGPCQDWLLAGSVDFALLYNIEKKLGLETLPLLNEPICLVGSHRLERPKGSGFPVARLNELELILPSESNGLRQLIDVACAAKGIRLEPRLLIDALGLLKELVRRGMGYTLMPISAVVPEVKAGEFWTIPLAEPKLLRAMVLARVADRPLSTAGRHLRETVVDEVRRLVSSGAWPPDITLP